MGVWSMAGLLGQPLEYFYYYTSALYMYTCMPLCFSHNTHVHTHTHTYTHTHTHTHTPDIPDNYLLYVEGACLTSLKDEVGEAASHRSVGRSGSLTHINDQQWLPDQGSEPILLKPNLSFRMQGITTSRVLAMM